MTARPRSWRTPSIAAVLAAALLAGCQGGSPPATATSAPETSPPAGTLSPPAGTLSPALPSPFTETPTPLGPPAETRPCADEPALRSTEGDTPAQVQFINGTAEEVRVLWRDYDGDRVLYAPLPPGVGYVQDTFLTHPWVVTDAQDECLGIFLPSEELTSASISAS